MLRERWTCLGETDHKAEPNRVAGKVGKGRESKIGSKENSYHRGRSSQLMMRKALADWGGPKGAGGCAGRGQAFKNEDKKSPWQVEMSGC